MKKMFSKSLAATALFSMCAMAAAAGVGGGIVVGGVGQAWQGTVGGKATSVSNGNTVAAATGSGNFASHQTADAISGGTATIGGAINNVGATVVTNTTQFSTVNTAGSMSGNAVGTQWNNGGEVIVNGSQAFASSENMAKGKANFNVGQIGGIIGVGGVAVVGGF